MTIGRIVARTLGSLAVTLLLAGGAAQAVEVIRDGTNALGIVDLNVNGTSYNVTFVLESAAELHGSYPGVFRFDTKVEAGDAVFAVNVVLNEENITEVGPVGSGSPLFKLAFDAGAPILDVELAYVRLAATEGGADWLLQEDTNFQVWPDPTFYAEFEVAGGVTTTTVAVTTTTSSGTTTTGSGTTTTGSGTTTTSSGTTTTTDSTTTTVVQAAVCSDAPLTGCVVAEKSSLKVKEKKVGKESIKAQLQKLLAGTTQADFGNPLMAGGTAYEVCIWDQEGFVDSLLVDQAGQTCGKKSKECWKDKKGKGWDYKDDLAASDGVKKIKLQSGTAGKGKIQADGANNEKKGQTALPTGVAAKLQGATAALVQVATSDAGCFSAVVNDVKKNDGVQFDAKGKVDAPDEPPPEEPDSLCNEDLCAENEALSEQCETFVQACLAFEAVNEDECAGGGILICEGGPPDGTDPGNVCSMNLCAANAGLAQECQDFLDTCLLAGEPEEDCVGAALFICLAEESF